MSLVDPNVRLYIGVMGQERGPYTVFELRELLRTGQIKQGITMARTTQEGSFWFPISHVPGLVSEKSWIVAIVLSALVGWFGVDRFYVGHIGLGIVKLVTCGGIGVWWLIDVILFAVDRVRDDAGLPLQR